MRWDEVEAGDIIIADWEDGEVTIEIFSERLHHPDDISLRPTGNPLAPSREWESYVSWSVLELCVFADGTCRSTPDIVTRRRPEDSPLEPITGILTQKLIRRGEILEQMDCATDDQDSV